MWKWIVGGIAGIGAGLGINNYLTKQPRSGDIANILASELSTQDVNKDLLKNIMLSLPSLSGTDVSVTVTSGVASDGKVQGLFGPEAGLRIPVFFNKNAIKHLTRHGQIVF